MANLIDMLLDSLSALTLPRKLTVVDLCSGPGWSFAMGRAIGEAILFQEGGEGR